MIVQISSQLSKITHIKISRHCIFKRLEIMFRMVNTSIAVCIKTMLKLRQGIYNCRGLLMLETHKIRTNLKSRCVSVLGVKLWNGLNNEIKMSKWMLVFKKALKSEIKGYNEI